MSRIEDSCLPYTLVEALGYGHNGSAAVRVEAHFIQEIFFHLFQFYEESAAI